MKRGFTMIELIFVIVIIGILAVIAIPKLSATRDDAKIATNLQNLSSCLQDIGAKYTATGKEYENSINEDFASCKNLAQAGCFTVTDPGNDPTDGNVTAATDGDNTDDQWCKDATKKAADRNLVGSDGAAKVHTFGGSKIVD